MYGHLPPISQTNKEIRARHAECSWRSKDKLIIDFILWDPAHGHISVGRPTKTYFYPLCADIGGRLEDLTSSMADRDGWWKSQRNLCWRHTLMIMMVMNIITNKKLNSVIIPVFQQLSSYSLFVSLHHSSPS